MVLSWRWRWYWNGVGMEMGCCGTGDGSRKDVGGIEMAVEMEMGKGMQRRW